MCRPRRSERTPWSQHPRVAAWRRRHAVVDVLVETADGFQRHRTSQSAALLAHYSFLSVFPLLLVFVTIIGFVLQDRPRLQTDIVDSALTSVPIIGPQLLTDAAGLRGSGVALAIGLMVALWAGLRAFVGAHRAIDDAWEVPLAERPNVFVLRARGLGMAVIVGVAQVLLALGSIVISDGDLWVVHRLMSAFGAVAVNVGLVALAYQVLSTPALSWRQQILPGAIPVGVILALLHLIGTLVVGRAISRATPVYGTFATVIALLTWLSLLSIVLLAGAELNAALHRRRRV